MDCDSERIWKIVENNRQDTAPFKRSSKACSTSLFERLHDVYLDQSCDKKEKSQRFRTAVNLIGSLEPPHSEIFLILTLYKDEIGYSIKLPHSMDKDDEMFLPYDDNEILNYIGNHQIPPFVQEVLLTHKCDAVYDEFIVCEVKNCRNSDDTIESHLILLNPIFETLNSETNLSIHMNFPLPSICLDPSTDVAFVANRLNFNHKKYSPVLMKRRLLKDNTRIDFDHFEESEWLFMLNYFKRKSLQRSVPVRKLSECWKCRRAPLRVPEYSDVLNMITRNAKELGQLHYSQKCKEAGAHEVPSVPELITTTSQVNEQIPQSFISSETSSTLKMEQSIENVTEVVPNTEPRPTTMHTESSYPETKQVSEGPNLPPLLSIYHTPRSPKGNLPKLHPLTGDASRIHYSHTKSRDIGTIGFQENFMPQLRKITSLDVTSMDISSKLEKQ